MRILFPVLLFLLPALGIAEEWTMEAPASPSSKVVMRKVAGESGARYTLSYMKDGEEPRVLWRTTIEDSPEKLEEGCGLLSADEENGRLAVLMESNIFELRLLSLDLPDGKLTGDRNIRAAALLARLPYEGGILQVKVPDRIEWKNTEGKTRSFVIENGTLRGEGDVGFDPSSYDPGWPKTPPDSSTPDGTTGGGATEGSPSPADQAPDTSSQAPSPVPSSSHGPLVSGPVIGGAAAVIALLLALVAFMKRKKGP